MSWRAGIRGDHRAEKSDVHGLVCGVVMRDEIETTLRLLGVTNLSQLGPHLVRSRAVRLHAHVQRRADCLSWLTPCWPPWKLNTKAIDPLLADRPSWGPDEQTETTWSIRK